MRDWDVLRETFFTVYPQGFFTYISSCILFLHSCYSPFFHYGQTTKEHAILSSTSSFTLHKYITCTFCFFPFLLYLTSKLIYLYTPNSRSFLLSLYHCLISIYVNRQKQALMQYPCTFKLQTPSIYTCYFSPTCHFPTFHYTYP